MALSDKAGFVERRVKVMGTIGPSSNDWGILDNLIREGLDVLRLNFAHIDPSDYPFTARLIAFARAAADLYGRNIAIFQDLGGIKLRIGSIDVKGGVVTLAPGQVVVLRDTEFSNDPEIIPFPHADLLNDLAVGDRVYLADGTIRLDVVGREGRDVQVKVQHGGDLSSHKGINVPGVSLNRPVLTEKDRQDARFGVDQQVDWVGVSFVQTPQDVRDAKAYLAAIGSEASVMSKLEKERVLAPENLEGVIEESDGVMVARGDLGIEIPMEFVPGWQKVILRKAQEAGKPAITATQMLSSMVHAPRPTRAECTDIQNSVLDGTSGILLSDEMAVGKYPKEVLRVAINNIVEGEKMLGYYVPLAANDSTEITVRAACQQAREYEGGKIVVVTRTGRAAIKTAKFLPQVPIIAVTHDVHAIRKLAMAWGVYPGGVIAAVQDVSELVRLAIAKAIETGTLDVEHDTHLMLIYGSDPGGVGVPGSTSTTRYLNLQDYLRQKDLYVGGKREVA